jgi:hypothetical protein
MAALEIPPALLTGGGTSALACAIVYLARKWTPPIAGAAKAIIEYTSRLEEQFRMLLVEMGRINDRLERLESHGAVHVAPPPPPPATPHGRE